MDDCEMDNQKNKNIRIRDAFVNLFEYCFFPPIHIQFPISKIGLIV